MRRAAKRDAVEGIIVCALRDAGWQIHFGMAPQPFDLICWRDKQVVLIEVKSRLGILTKSQADAIRGGAPIRIVRSLDDIMDLTA